MAKEKFLSTIWTIIDKAKQKDPSAFQDLFLRYKDPVMCFLSKKGFEKDAEDLTQEVFLKIFDENLLQKVDRSKGRFRNFILAVTKNIVGSRIQKNWTQKRGAEKEILSLETVDVDTIPAEEQEEFAKLWLLNLLEKACAKLEDECKKKGLLYHVAFRFYVDQNMTYQEIADQMNKSFHEVKNYIHLAKQKIKEYIQEEIVFYSGSLEEYNEELEQLSKYLEL